MKRNFDQKRRSAMKLLAGRPVDEYVVKPDDDRSSATHGVQEPETHRALVERHSLIVRGSDFGRFRRRATPFTPAGLIGSFARALKIARE
jgi:hypothetical protein